MPEPKRRAVGREKPVPPPMNLQVLEPSRKACGLGDVFVMRPAGGPFYFGRVARLGVGFIRLSDAPLIYLYDAHSDDPGAVPDLDPRRLLVPPLVTNFLPWRKGYFRTIVRRPLAEGDLLPRHCFRSFDGSYYDADNQKLPRRSEPCGVRGLHSFRTIDLAVSKALRLPTTGGPSRKEE